MNQKVAVIGGGPAGVLAAAFSAKRGNDTVLFEKNEKLLKKLFITGKGRCNITNRCDISDFFANIPKNPDFLYSALYSFTNEDIIALLESVGVQVKTERGNRVFPVTDKAGTVCDGLRLFLKQSGAKVKLSTTVTAIKKQNDLFDIITKDGTLFGFHKVILATGGKSYPVTGSTGDGYRFSEQLGHTVTPLSGNLVPLETDEAYGRELSGLSLRNISLKMKNQKGKIIFEDFGEMMFTHFGVTGPLIISASSHLPSEPCTLHLDLKPALNEKQLDERLLRDFQKFANKAFHNSLGELLPKSLIPVMVSLSGIDPQKQCNSITREERKALLDLLKNFTLHVKGKRPIEEAIITSGGVSVKEINPSTMESKLVEGLYFCGELIDTDAYTGGFNLQIAYSTGYLAGTNV